MMGVVARLFMTVDDYFLIFELRWIGFGLCLRLSGLPDFSKLDRASLVQARWHPIDWDLLILPNFETEHSSGTTP